MKGILKVEPQKLINTANEFNATGRQVSTLTQQMLEMVDSLKSTWEGEAANTYSKKFHQLEDDMKKMHSMIEEHVKDLNDMAQQYIKAENVNIETGNALAGDIIS